MIVAFKEAKVASVKIKYSHTYFWLIIGPSSASFSPNTVRV